MFGFKFIAVLIFASISSVLSHSWIECTNYDPPSFDHDKLGDFDRSRCSGYSRGFDRQFKADFGIDTGYNWEHPECNPQYSSSDYTADAHMATYQSGQIVYISHPAKNHVASDCTNAFIPSTSMELLMSSVSYKDTFDISVPMIGGDHVNGQVDYLGYQRCFNFCGNPDKAHCITGWQLAENVPEGRYSFHWRWEFNSGQTYSNCFDAYISNSAGVSTFSPDFNSSSSSGSNADDTIIEPLPSVLPTPAHTTPAPVQTDISITFDSTSDSGSAPTDTPAPVAEVISSAGSSLVSPLSIVKSYLLNITGNVSALFNITMSQY